MLLLAGIILALCEIQVADAADAASNQAPMSEDTVLSFEIRKYTLDGATLLSKDEISNTVAPYIGKNKDFSDVERALEAIEALYAKKGFTTVHISLPEQELEKGDVHFHVIETRFGKVTVKHNKFIKFVTDENALNALPSVKTGYIPVTKEIARELKLANENPARQLDVVLKAGKNKDEVDANVIVTDAKPSAWGVNYDNSGTVETGRSRIGLSYRYANLFDKDHIASFQTQISPEHTDRVRIFSGNYKIPLYSRGDSMEFSAAYSNVNSLVGGLNNFQGGGEIFGYRYNHALDKIGPFDPRLSYGLELRDFKPVQQTTAPVTVLYNEIVVTPASLAISLQGKVGDSDVGLNASAAANFPWMSKGKSADFAQYDQINSSNPKASYKVVRFGGNYLQPLGGDWQFRLAFSGQWSGDELIQGEQIRLGGMDGVRGFSEGSEGGDKGIRGNLEFYAPVYLSGKLNLRGLVFYDAGQASTNPMSGLPAATGSNVSIASYGVGLRSAYSDSVSFRVDAGRIAKEGADPEQVKGDWRVHLVLSAAF